MKIIHRLIIFYFNISGVSNFQLRKEVKMSKIFLALNLLSYPVALVLNLSVPPSFISQNTRKEFRFPSGISNFLVIALSYLGMQYAVITLVCIYVPIFIRKKIERLTKISFKVARQFQVFPESTTTKQFVRKVLTLSFTCFTIGFISKLTFMFAVYKFSWQGCVLTILTDWFDNTGLASIISLGLFLVYYVFLLKALNFQIKNSLKIDLENLNYKLKIINELMTEFNKTFGFLLTALAFFAISLTIIRVNWEKIKTLENFKINFQFLIQLYLCTIAMFGIVKLNFEYKVYSIISTVPFFTGLIVFIIKPCQQLKNEVFC